MSRGSQIGIVSQRRDKGRMLVSADEVPEQAPTIALGHGEHAETEVEDVDRTSSVEVPPMPSRSGKRHLSGRRDHILLNFGP